MQEPGAGWHEAGRGSMVAAPVAAAGMPGAAAMPAATKRELDVAVPAQRNGPAQPVPPAPAPVTLTPEKQVLACLKAGMYREAVTLLKGLIAGEPQQVDHYFNLSVACWRLRDLPGAQAALERCLELDGNYYRALCNLAGLLFEQGDLAGAQAYLERAVAINPLDGHSQYNLKLVMRKRSGNKREKKPVRH